MARERCRLARPATTSSRQRAESRIRVLYEYGANITNPKPSPHGSVAVGIRPSRRACFAARGCRHRG
ncbi:protein of unknown function (plasmid) [Cupriavidus taiwanensis]|nr:protein of unknown function [Cupriavidus taiwanensis]